jgi:hypothetical protein
MRITKVELSSVTDIVFHATDSQSLQEILQDNRFHLTSDLGTGSDQKSGRKKFAPYFFSMSRIKYGGYLRSFGKNWAGLVNLVIDGQKLNQKYHGLPVDYWGPSYRPDTMETNQRLRNNENEERVYSDKPYIGPVNKYIKEIHLFIAENVNKLFILNEKLSDKDSDQACTEARRYRKIVGLASIQGIAMFIYSDFEAFKNLNKRKALPPNRFSRSRSSGDLQVFIELLETKNKSDLSEDAYERLYRCYVSPDESKTILDNEIHNAKSGDRAEKLAVDQFIGWMRKLKLRSTKEVIELISNKFPKE